MHEYYYATCAIDACWGTPDYQYTENDNEWYDDGAGVWRWVYSYSDPNDGSYNSRGHASDDEDDDNHGFESASGSYVDENGDDQDWAESYVWYHDEAADQDVWCERDDTETDGEWDCYGYDDDEEDWVEVDANDDAIKREEDDFANDQ